MRNRTRALSALVRGEWLALLVDLKDLFKVFGNDWVGLLRLLYFDGAFRLLGQFYGDGRTKAAILGVLAG